MTEFSISPDHQKEAIRVVANRPHSLTFDKGISGKDFVSVIAPPLSTIIAGADAYHDLREGNYAPAMLNAAIAGLGVLPMTGDAAELVSIVQVGEKAARTGSETVGNIVENAADVAEAEKIEKSFVLEGLTPHRKLLSGTVLARMEIAWIYLPMLWIVVTAPSGFISTSKTLMWHPLLVLTFLLYRDRRMRLMSMPL
ncbi:hypothetical protein RAA17_05655 [Komagataeibacter rhaeticus]|nr:hypothetical protein [Komagataeibacter rhaeticus]